MKIKQLLITIFFVISGTISWSMVAENTHLPAPPALSMANPVLYKTTAEWEDFISTTASGWKALWSEDSEIPWAVYGPPIALGGRIDNSADAVRVGERFLSEHQSLLGLTGSGWVAGIPKLVKDIWMVPFREIINGVPVFGGRIDLRITDTGELMGFFARTHSNLLVSSVPALSQSACFSQIRNSRYFGNDLELETAGLEFLPQENQATLCWRMDIRGKEPHQRWTVWVDAQTGEVRAAVSRVATDFVSGYITGEALPFYWNDPLTAYPFSWENVQVDGDWTVSDSSAHWGITVPGSAPYELHSILTGPYVAVDYADGDDASYDTLAPTSPHNWIWNISNSRTDERNLFHHTNVVHDYYKGLDPEFTGMDYPVPAVCEYGNAYANAFWNGYGTYYGNGGSEFRSFALFCDVIYHEYTHGVTDQIYPPGYLPYIDQSGAMNEGWSDYFACTITNEPLVGEGGLYQMGSQYLRNLDNTLIYPTNWVGEVHADGAIIGGAFWDLRELVGADVSDQLVHFTKYGLSEDFISYFIDLLMVDDNDHNIANGSPHSVEIYDAFGIHGIGPGIIPRLGLVNYSFDDDATAPSSGNGNGFIEAGEVVEFWTAIENEGYLYPPPAEDVTVSVTSLHPDVVVVQGQVVIGEMAFGQTEWTPSPLVLQVASSAQDEFVDLVVTMSANGGTVTVQDTVEISLGIPRVLLADDDGGGDYESFYFNALHAINQTYYWRDVTSGVNPSDLVTHPWVIWFCGDRSTQTVSASDQEALTNHLLSGGRLILTGQNVGDDIHETSFFQNVLGAIHTDDSVHFVALDGVAGDVLGDDHWLLLIGSAGAQNQLAPAGSQAQEGAVESFHYRDDPEQRAGCIRREDPSGYRTIYFSFGLEGVSGMANSTPLSELLETCLTWLEGGTWVRPAAEVKTPLVWSLQPPYPNPFNPVVALEFTVPGISKGMIVVYNVLGQRVEILEQGNWQAGSHRILWNAEALPSGVYFLRLEAPGIQKVQRMVLMK